MEEEANHQHFDEDNKTAHTKVIDESIVSVSSPINLSILLTLCYLGSNELYENVFLFASDTLIVSTPLRFSLGPSSGSSGSFALLAESTVANESGNNSKLSW